MEPRASAYMAITEPRIYKLSRAPRITYLLIGTVLPPGGLLYAGFSATVLHFDGVTRVLLLLIGLATAVGGGCDLALCADPQIRSLS